ncbi:hypothetical protein EYF80_016771 [Liparis tanakae]|uniref:Uncharacterized protein n=1 Tax=Liparis tanakae TaxID=230148 RepID=A0A4Z2I5D4_9TELE|nr:hypothetical protein EYF80_016771 [Liparis tanakae]
MQKRGAAVNPVPCESYGERPNEVSRQLTALSCRLMVVVGPVVVRVGHTNWQAPAVWDPSACLPMEALWNFWGTRAQQCPSHSGLNNTRIITQREERAMNTSSYYSLETLAVSVCIELGETEMERAGDQSSLAGRSFYFASPLHYCTAGGHQEGGVLGFKALRLGIGNC